MIQARRGAERGIIAAGWAYIGVGLCFYLLIFDTAWWLATGFVSGEPPVRVLEQGLPVAGGSLDVLVLLGMGVVLVGMGSINLYDARRLRRLRLVIDQRGISQDDRPQVLAPWDRIRHVAVTAGKPGWRRLLVDDGRLPEDYWLAPKVYPGRALLRLLARRRRFLVNVPVDRLDATATEIVRAVRHHSGGTFPDRGNQQLG